MRRKENLRNPDLINSCKTYLVSSWNFDVTARDVPIPPVEVGPAELGVVASVKLHVIDQPPEDGLNLSKKEVRCND